MKHNIKLLIENLFDDIYNIEDNKNLDIEFSDELLKYNITDLIYKHKKPYAICCGKASEFKDNDPRFLLLTKPVFKQYAKIPSYLELLGKKTIKDENGFNNTQIIKNQYYSKSFPAFDYCINLGSNVYLPAIKEIITLFKYNNNINNMLAKIPDINTYLFNTNILTNIKVLSSSQVNDDNYYCLFRNNIIEEHKLNSKNTLVYPFVKI